MADLDPPLTVAIKGLHAYRRHTTRLWKVGEFLKTGGFSLIGDRRCDCGSDATAVIAALLDAGYVIVPDEDDHYVTFDASGWFVEHSIACRQAGTLGTCAYNAAIREIAIDFDAEGDPEQPGRWKITNIDSEGLPLLERA